jgi:tetratricopeptide (TPR) repeat protein
MDPFRICRSDYGSGRWSERFATLFGVLLAPTLALTLAPVRAQTPRNISVAAGDQAKLKRALDVYDAGDLRSAEPMLTDLATRYPRSYEANEALGSLYAETDRNELAVRYLRRACSIAPREGIAHANLGAAYLKSNNAGAAIPELRLALRDDPENAATLGNLGQALMLSAKPLEAAKAFAAASAHDPADAELTYNLALALYESGGLRDAATTLGRVSPTTDQTEELAGDIAEKLGDYKQAIEHYQAAAHLNPSDANLYALTVELMRHWTWDEAVKLAAFGASRYPKSTHFEVAEGIAEYGGQHYAEAVVTFSTLLQSDPDNAMYADLLGRSCSAIADDASAQCLGLAEFAHHHPENAQAATYAAVSLLHRPAAEQDQVEVKRLLDQAIAANPRLPEAWYQMAVLEQAGLQWKESATALDKAIALRPTYPEAHYRLSRAYAHLGMKDEAQREISLQQKYSQQAKDSLNAHLQEVVTFLVESNAKSN